MLGGGTPVPATGQAYGERQPAVRETASSPVEVEAQRRNNRRVEIKIVRPSPPASQAPATLYPGGRSGCQHTRIV
jgi:hypothetical protein